jgi:hypothetical protein
VGIAIVANQNDNFADSITTMTLAYGGAGNTLGHQLGCFVDILAIGPSQIPAVFTITDSNGNAWKPGPRLDVPIGDQTDSRCAAFMFVPSSLGGANSVTLSTLGVTYNMGLAIFECSGCDTVNPLSTVVSYGYSNLVSTQKQNPALNALRTDYANTITFIGISAEDSSPGVGTGWTDLDDNTHLQVSYSILTTAGYKVPNWTTGASNYYGGLSMTLHAGTSIAPPPTPPRTRAYSHPQLPLQRLPILTKGVLVSSPTTAPPPVVTKLNAPLFGTEA